ncbi:flavoprotein [Streptococcus pneumoniae]|nr:flavoprotein [Streptococcus pneumoniae]
MDKKNLLVLVTGSVGASNVDTYLYYIKKFYNVKVILSENSKKFISKELISYFCDKVYDEIFVEEVVPHVFLPYESDLLLILPATANVIGKIANGIADDLVTATVLNFNKKNNFLSQYELYYVGQSHSSKKCINSKGVGTYIFI